MMYIEHDIVEGDRWDLLAYLYWGDSNLAPLLIVDNRHISVMSDLPVGEICYIRETVDEADQLTTNDTLPFWKR